VSRRSRLTGALGFLQLEPRAPELRLLHNWLDSWSGIGLIVVGMSHQGFQVSVGEHGAGQWIAVFYSGRGGHEAVAGAGTALEEAQEPHRLKVRVLNNAVVVPVLDDVPLDVVQFDAGQQFRRRWRVENIDPHAILRNRRCNLVVGAQSPDDLADDAHYTRVSGRVDDVALLAVDDHRDQLVDEIEEPAASVSGDGPRGTPTATTPVLRRSTPQRRVGRASCAPRRRPSRRYMSDMRGS
jgi:hypothetical protein